MKIAVVYNRESQKVINLFGMPNREKYGLKAIKRIVTSLKKGGHQVMALEGDKDLIDNLEEFMPRVLKGERPGLVFNLSYGIQGQARYTHVPGILEMVGMPYVGSGPLAHSLALDKVVAKMIFKQTGLPTPDFAVLNHADEPLPQDLAFPLIVKPKNEAVSFGIRIVENLEELREAAGVIFAEFSQAVLVEQYIAGREVNVGILGNNPVEAFEPAELHFGDKGPAIYTLEDKKRQSGREIGVSCPADLPAELAQQAKEISIKAFNALGCYDCARVDMRLDSDGNLYILEINSLPSLGEHGSYVAAAQAMGMDFTALVNRLVEVASTRYFGTPAPPQLSSKKTAPSDHVFSYITSRRDQMENSIKKWSSFSSRSADLVGHQLTVKELGARFKDLRLQAVPELTNDKVVWTWQSQAGMDNGTLFLLHCDEPVDMAAQRQVFRRDPEWLYGEAVGTVWAPLTMLEYAFRSLRAIRKLRRIPLGVLCYFDEGHDCRYSTDLIRQAIDRASQVVVMRPGGNEGEVILQRRGQRKYMLVVEGEPLKLGQTGKKTEVSRWLLPKLDKLAALSSRKERIALSEVNISSDAYPMRLPHRLNVTLLASYPSQAAAIRLHQSIIDILEEGRQVKWNLELVSERPAMHSQKSKNPLFNELQGIASDWDIPLGHTSSVWPSVAGLVPRSTPALCGMGPVARDIYTAQEAVQRVSIVQRTLLLAQFLTKQIK